MNEPLLCFKSFVPPWMRIGLFIAFAMVFQCANVTYPSLMGDVTGASQFYKEDLSFIYQVSTIGVTFIFPLLFRIKFRFTSQQILTGCSLALSLLLLICMYTDSIPVLIVCAFLVGALKMIGTFETLVSIQLVITRHKDYGMFFSVALGIVLFCGQLSGTVAIELADKFDWQMMHSLLSLLLGVQSILILLLLKPYRIAKSIPLYGIDWWGIVHWSILFSSVSYILIYGRLLDWYASEKIATATVIALVWAVVVVYRTLTIRRSLILPRVFKLKNVLTAVILILVSQVFLNTTGSIVGPFTNGVMRLDNLHTGALNWWIAAGILLGAGFGYWWFKYINGSFRFIFGIGFALLTLHHALLYFSFSTVAGEQQLYLPYFLKGAGNVIIFAAAGKYMTIGVGFDIFTQMLCVVAMIRNAIGNVLMGAVINENVYRLSQDYLQKLSSKIDDTDLQFNSGRVLNQALKSGWATHEGSQFASKALYAKFSQNALLLAGRDIFGWVTILGFIVLGAICCYHFSAPIIKSFPSWRKIFTLVKRSSV